MSDKPYCPWCGRNMDELENGKIDGHAWYRDDSDYIQNIERSRDFMKGRIEQLEQLCHDLYRIAAHEGYIGNELHNRLVELGFAEGEQE